MKTCLELDEADLFKAVADHLRGQGYVAKAMSLDIDRGDPGHPGDAGPKVTASATVEKIQPDGRP